MSVATVSGPPAASSLNYVNALTPEALLGYCQSRLRAIDGQIRTQFEKQEKYRAVSSQLNTLQQAMTSRGNTASSVVTDPNNAELAKGGTSKDQIDAAFKAAIDSCPPGEARDQIIKAKEQWDKSGGKLCGKDASDMASAFANISKDINAASELDMITLNGLVSQRQLAVQTTASLQANVYEGGKFISGKMSV